MLPLVRALHAYAAAFAGLQVAEGDTHGAMAAAAASSASAASGGREETHEVGTSTKWKPMPPLRTSAISLTLSVEVLTTLLLTMGVIPMLGTLANAANSSPHDVSP